MLYRSSDFLLVLSDAPVFWVESSKRSLHTGRVSAAGPGREALKLQQKPYLNTESRCLWTWSDLMCVKALKEVLGTWWKKWDDCLFFFFYEKSDGFFFQQSVRKNMLCILEHEQNFVRTNTQRGFYPQLRDLLWLYTTHGESLLKENLRLCHGVAL